MEASTEAHASPSGPARRGGFRPNLAGRGGRKPVSLGQPGASSSALPILQTDLIAVAGKRKDTGKEKDDEPDDRDEEEATQTTPQKKPRLDTSTSSLTTPTSSGPSPIVSARASRAASAVPSSPTPASPSSGGGGPPPIRAKRASTLKDVVRANSGTPMAPTGSEEQVRSINRPTPREETATAAAPRQAMGPQVTIDPETGEIVIDQQSLLVNTTQRDESVNYSYTYEDQESKNTNFQRHRRKNQRNKWTREQTDAFYNALRRYGTDFTLIQLLFPDRSRDQIRNKFKKEEKENGPRIDLALRSRLPIEENEHRLLADRAKAIAEQEKRARELKENGESDIPAPAPAAQPAARKGPSVIAPAIGRPTETAADGGAEAAADEAPVAPKTTIGPNGEIIMDRSDYEAQHRYDDDEVYDAGGYDDDGDDYGYTGGGNDDHDDY